MRKKEVVYEGNEYVLTERIPNKEHKYNPLCEPCVFYYFEKNIETKTMVGHCKLDKADIYCLASKSEVYKPKVNFKDTYNRLKELRDER